MEKAILNPIDSDAKKYKCIGSQSIAVRAERSHQWELLEKQRKKQQKGNRRISVSLHLCLTIFRRAYHRYRLGEAFKMLFRTQHKHNWINHVQQTHKQPHSEPFIYYQQGSLGWCTAASVAGKICASCCVLSYGTTTAVSVYVCVWERKKREKAWDREFFLRRNSE